MATNNDANDLDLTVPERARIMSYQSGGVPESQARAAALRDFGYTNKEIAEKLDVTPDAASSYYSKFQQSVSEALTLVLSAFGGPKSIEGWQMVHDDDVYDKDDEKEWWFAVKPINSEQDLRDARQYPPEGEFVLIKVRGDEMSFSAESERYETLDAMADDIYRNAEFDSLNTAQEVHGVLTEAGLASDALPDPRSQVDGVFL